MNPLFTLGDFDFMTLADSVRMLEMQNFGFLPQFCASFDVCGVLPSRYTAETLFTMGKGLKEFQLCDSRRFRKKPQDGKVYRIWTPKGGPAQYCTRKLRTSQQHLKFSLGYQYQVIKASQRSCPSR